MSMLKFLALASLSILLVPTMATSPADAGWNKSKSKYSSSRRSSSKRYAKRRGSKRAQVRGFRRRGGGYSYSGSDVINTYGDSRTRYGGVNAYRDPFSDRQTVAGPFDHGWFFDSATGPRGGDSPYMQ